MGLTLLIKYNKTNSLLDDSKQEFIYATLKEVVNRMYKRLNEEEKKLIVISGCNLSDNLTGVDKEKLNNMFDVDILVDYLDFSTRKKPKDV